MHRFAWLLFVSSVLIVHSAHSQCTVKAGNDTAICQNEPLLLTATTTGGPVISFEWTTIPASTPVAGNPFVVPTTVADTFTYVVTATMDTCTVKDTVTVIIHPLPAASFTISPAGECGSTPVSFTNTSSGIGLSYYWDFGDPNSGTANTSSATHPIHRFIGTPGTATQTFTVTLIVTSIGGCKDTMTQQTSIKQTPGTELGGTGYTIYNGLKYFTTCSNTTSANFSFTNQSSTSASNIDYTIIWGDNSPNFTSGSGFSVANHIYTTGNYTLLFIVTGAASNSCPDTATYYVFVGSNPAVGLNNPGNTTVCSGTPLNFPISGTFSNPPGTTYTTIFNDGSPQVVLVHPPPAMMTHVFDSSSCGTNSTDGTNVYNNSFSAIIVASNPCGSSSSAVVPIYVSQGPTANFDIAPNDTACTSNTITFTDKSIGNYVQQNGVCLPGRGVWSVSPATGWTIVSGSLGNDFGLSDPTTWMAGSATLQLNFATPGIYKVKMKTGSSAWCDADSLEKTICISAEPVAAFSINQNSGCAPFTVNTVNTSSAAFCGNNTYNWSVSYTATIGCMPDAAGYTFINGTNAASANPQIEFTNPGVYTLTLIVTSPGGTCTAQAVQQITVKGKPVVTLISPPAICAGESINPTASSTCYETTATYTWSFPSGLPSTASSQNPGTITYNSAGNFDVIVNVTNECGTTTEINPISVITVSASDAGPSQNLCGTSVTMAANIPAIGSGQWSYVSGPAGYNITDPSLPNTTVTGLVPGNYVFEWTISNGSCVSSSTVSISISTGPTTANAGPDQNLCLVTSATLSANTPSIGTGQWSYVNGPAGYNITDPSLPNTTVTGLIPGIYTFRWTTSFSNCTPSFDDVQITIYDNPSSTNAGNDQTICASTVTMAGNVPVIGNGTWTLVNGPNTPAITNPSSPATTITGLVPGTYIFKWTISNGACPATEDEVQIIVTPYPTTADAGPDQSICALSTATLSGNTPVTGTGQWSFVSGPAGYNITDPSLPNTTVTSLVPGTYVFKWTISNGVCPASEDEVQIIINENATVADAGPSQNLCGSTITMAANTPVIGTGQWSYVSGPAGYNITDLSLPNTTVTNLVPGTYVFQWVITNGTCISASNVTIIISTGPTPANAGPDQNWCLQNTATLSGNIPSIGTGQWSYVSGPAGYNITDPSLNNTTVTGLAPGTYTFKWTTSFSNCPISTDDVQITIYDNPTAANAGNDQTICVSSVTMSGNTPVIGNGTWTVASGPNAPAITNASSPSTTITGLAPGTYVFQWTIANGVCAASTDNVQVIVTPFPTTADAGPDQTLCNVSSITLGGNNPAIGTGQWTFVNGPAGSTISDASLPGTAVTGIATGTYTFQWTIANGVCPSSTDQVQIVNLEAIQNSISNTIATICAGQTVTLTGNNPTGGNGAYTYQWESSPDGTTWTAVTGGILKDLTITLTATTCFRRKVTSLPCENYSNIICINVQPALANNIIAADQSICINTSAATITGALPTGGDGVYTYQWQQSTDGINWPDISGATGIDYSPGVLTDTMYYRRVVNTALCSGLQANISNTVTIIVHEDAKALFSAAPVIDCAPFDLGAIINVTAFPDRNGQYQWFADGSSIGNNTSGAAPVFTINNPGDTVIIKLLTSSQHGCLPDSMDIEFITVTTAFANFTESNKDSCGPLTVSFTNTTSVLNSSIEYYWNFGNGSLSTAMNPAPVTYQSSPEFRDTTYYITLKAFNGCDTTYHPDSVTVHPGSKARFGVDTTRGCSPFTLHITNTSPGNNFAYYWDFGDGSADTTNSNGPLSHTYYTGVVDTFTVRLISENQCTRDTQSVDIVVSPITIQPFVAISGDQVTGCAPHLVTFNNTSVGAVQLTWNFNDGSPVISTPNDQEIITHIFENAGVYDVSIRLQNDCSDTTITRSVTVLAPPNADFTLSSLLLCTGQPVTVANTSANANSIEWIWDDGSPSSFANTVQHVFNTAGVHDIKLVATRVHPSGVICRDTIVKQVNVLDKVLAQINVAPGKFCEPYTLNVTAVNTAGASQIEWIIYDSSSAPGEFHINGPAASHIYDVAGVYSVKLIITTTDNCKDSVTYPFEVFHTPKTIFTPDDIVTCSHDTTVTFLAAATNTGNNPVNYKWFVNNSIEGTVNPFSYEFAAPDDNTAPVDFYIRALAENAAGCGDTSLTGKLTILPLPWPGIKVSPAYVLQQPDYTFTFEDTVATNPNKIYLWDLGDHSGQTRSGQEITYEYSDTGTYNVKLTVTDFSTGCSAIDTVKVRILYVPGYLYVPNAMCLGCSNNSLRQFLPLGKGLKKYKLTIYTTWGQKIFETTSLNSDGSPNEPWDGKFNGKPLQQDVYSWQIEATYTNGTEWKGMLYPGSNKYVKAGFVTIIK